MIDKKAVIKSYKKTYNMAETAKEFGVSRERIRQILNEVQGLPKGRRKKSDALTEKVISKLASKYSLTNKLLAKKSPIKISQETARRAVQEFGGIEKQRRYKNPKLTNELLKKLYYEDKLPQTEIAKRFGYSQTNISRILQTLK
jgi:transposase